MEKENTEGFKLYSGKSNSPFTPLNLMSSTFVEAKIFPDSLERIQELSGNLKASTKTKIIQKGRDKQQVKRYDRGGNCVASNTSKLFIKILNKRLRTFPVIQKYLNFYQIYSQKQNILLIPLCLYSFLKEYEQNYHIRFQSDLEVAHRQIFQSQIQKINTRQVYTDIITQLKDHIECSLENSRAKYKDCSDSKKQFHLKNISIYNKISEIIKKVQILVYGLEQSENKSIGNQGMKTFAEGGQKSSPHNSDIKIEQQQLHYNQFHQKPTHHYGQPTQHQPIPLIHQHSSLHHIMPSYELQTFQSPLQSLYERKQRQYQKAMDKVFSIIMNERPLRQLFHIYKLNVKEILIESVNYCYRRNINSRVKKNQKIVKEIFERMENEVIEALQIKRDNMIMRSGDRNTNDYQFQLRGWEFLIAFLTLQVAGDKKVEIYQEFKQNIKRKTKYFSLVQTKDPKNEKNFFDKYYYDYSLRILEQHYDFEVKKKTQTEKQNLVSMEAKLKQWLIGYNYHNVCNKMCIQEPKVVPRIVPETQGVFETHKIELMHNPANMIVSQRKPQVKQEESHILEGITHRESEKEGTQKQFGLKSEMALKRLVSQFQNLSKENYENFY